MLGILNHTYLDLIVFFVILINKSVDDFEVDKNRTNHEKINYDTTKVSFPQLDNP